MVRVIVTEEGPILVEPLLDGSLPDTLMPSLFSTIWSWSKVPGVGGRVKVVPSPFNTKVFPLAPVIVISSNWELPKKAASIASVRALFFWPRLLPGWISSKRSWAVRAVGRGSIDPAIGAYGICLL
jgi:hypothetical protein